MRVRADIVSDNHIVGSHIAEKSLAEKQPPVKVSGSQKQMEDRRKGVRYISFPSLGIWAEFKSFIYS